jgi:hypothetical protein
MAVSTACALGFTHARAEQGSAEHAIDITAPRPALVTVIVCCPRFVDHRGALVPQAIRHSLCAFPTCIARSACRDAGEAGSSAALGFTELSEGALAEQHLYALPGKVPLIKKTYRPPNFETPVEYFRTPITSNAAFFVRWHLAGISISTLPAGDSASEATALNVLSNSRWTS